MSMLLQSRHCAWALARITALPILTKGQVCRSTSPILYSITSLSSKYHIRLSSSHLLYSSDRFTPPLKPISVNISSTAFENWRESVPVLCIGLCSDDLTPSSVGIIDNLTDGALSLATSISKFKGERDAMVTVPLKSKDMAKNSIVIFIGLGKSSKLNRDSVRRFGAKSISSLKSCSSDTIGFVVPRLMGSFDTVNASNIATPPASTSSELSELLNDMSLQVRLLTEGSILSYTHSDKRYKKIDSTPDSSPIPSVSLYISNQISPSELSTLTHSIDRTMTICRGVKLARELVNDPPDVATPMHLAAVAKEISRESPDRLVCRVYEKEECSAMGMDAFLGVSAGSDEPPKFIHVTYTPIQSPGETLLPETIVLIGKAVTFDSGGYNLKVGSGSQIEKMKIDMAGAACVLGTALSLCHPSLAPKCPVHFIAAACENMISGAATQPGSIVTASDGTTIEINNTDAEGRLTLADALTFVRRRIPTATIVIDIATLTGACGVALGPDIAGLFSNSDKLADTLMNIGKNNNEKIWRLPLESSYTSLLESSIADIKNSAGGGLGGSITAALFLKRFILNALPSQHKVKTVSEAVDEGDEGSSKVCWAHIDAAYPVFKEKGDGGVHPHPGLATGFGVRTFSDFIDALSKSYK